jgi:hypothetical protein
MPQSTPLDQLQDETVAAPPADEERVKRILAEMNVDNTVQSQPPVGAPMQRVISEPPIAISTGDLRMDVGTARANVIGNSIPTMADFQAMFNQTSPGMAPIHGPAIIPASQNAIPHSTVTKSKSASLVQQLRGPVAVAIIIFLLNLPVVTTILSRYASWMYLSSGEISIGGLFVKALLAGILFAGYQGVTSILDR